MSRLIKDSAERHCHSGRVCVLRWARNKREVAGVCIFIVAKTASFTFWQIKLLAQLPICAFLFLISSRLCLEPYLRVLWFFLPTFRYYEHIDYHGKRIRNECFHPSPLIPAQQRWSPFEINSPPTKQCPGPSSTLSNISPCKSWITCTGRGSLNSLWSRKRQTL